MEIYQSIENELKKASRKLSLSDKRMSGARLLTILSAGFLLYQAYQRNEFFLYVVSLIILIAFLILIKKHQKIKWENDLTKTRLQVNQDEKAFITNGTLPFDNGEEFIDTNHSYSYDLDFFGDKSLYQTLNRT
ncbi:MAG: hypothetical protein AAFY41_19860, partial [Bacteroidota bacterium]